MKKTLRESFVRKYGEEKAGKYLRLRGQEANRASQIAKLKKKS